MCEQVTIFSCSFSIYL